MVERGGWAEQRTGKQFKIYNSKLKINPDLGAPLPPTRRVNPEQRINSKINL